jgi:lysophospholipase L1-like esterase
MGHIGMYSPLSGDWNSTNFQSRWFLSSVEVSVPDSSRAFVIVGDSITDGRGSDTDKNNRWPDLVLAKMQQNRATSNIAVINKAAGGNRILYDGLGPNALSRIDRDVLAQPGLTYAMIFEGVNDIGTAATDTATQKNVGDRIIAAYKQIALRLQAFDVPVFAATITPFSAPNGNVTLQVYTDPNREATRQRVNSWIRNSGAFDDVVDFDAILRNSTHPNQLADVYNSGDYLHPNVKGYQLLADKFPLSIFN